MAEIHIPGCGKIIVERSNWSRDLYLHTPRHHIHLTPDQAYDMIRALLDAVQGIEGEK